MTTRFKTVGMLAASLALVLTGCSGESANEPPATEPSETATVESIETVAPEETEPAEPTPEPSEESSPPAEPEAQISARGNRIKKVGEPAGMVHEEDDDEWWLKFAVTGIEVDPTCTDAYADKPERGHFVVFDVEVETASSLIEDLEKTGLWADSVNFHPSSFKLIDSDGYSLAESDSLAGYGCLEGDWQLPPDIGPGEKVRGSVVFDSPTEHGVIAYELIDGRGWEWEF